MAHVEIRALDSGPGIPERERVLERFHRLPEQDPSIGVQSHGQQKRNSMAHERTRALSEVLDQLEATVHDESVSVQEIMDHLGKKSFAALILVFALLSTSPASAIPGLTTAVALAVAIMVVQMLIGRECLWLPDFIAAQRLPTARVCQAVAWLRRPVRFVERFFKARLSFFVERPGIFLTLGLMLVIAAFMPIMEVVPTSGSIASAVIAFFAAGLLTRDGALVCAGLVLVAATPVVVASFGFSG